ncbi:MAG: signal peptidase I [Gaiellales bacterium]
MSRKHGDDAAEETGKKHGRWFHNPIDRLTSRLPDPWRGVADWAITIAIAVIAVFLLKGYVVNPYRIPSSSMEPELHCAEPGFGCEAKYNDRVLANRFILHFRDPHRGDIIVFDPPSDVVQACGAGGTYVKRLVGLPGETLSVRDGYVYIDGKKLDEPYIEDVRRGTDNSGPWKLGDDEYFMMGDNRSASCDSRRWGPISREQMIGPVLMVYWPPNRIGFR